MIANICKLQLGQGVAAGEFHRKGTITWKDCLSFAPLVSVAETSRILHSGYLLARQRSLQSRRAGRHGRIFEGPGHTAEPATSRAPDTHDRAFEGPGHTTEPKCHDNFPGQTQRGPTGATAGSGPAHARGGGAAVGHEALPRPASQLPLPSDPYRLGLAAGSEPASQRRRRQPARPLAGHPAAPSGPRPSPGSHGVGGGGWQGGEGGGPAAPGTVADLLLRRQGWRRAAGGLPLRSRRAAARCQFFGRRLGGPRPPPARRPPASGASHSPAGSGPGVGWDGNRPKGRWAKHAAGV